MEKGYLVCVDDEPSVLETLREQLQESFGDTHEIEIANSAEEGLQLIEEIRGSGAIVEVVVTDQVMPGMKGDEFLEEVHRRLPESIKILLTGQAGLDNAIHAVNYGGLNRYVEKPWNKENLRRDVAELIARFKENIDNQRMLNNLEKRVHELEADLDRLRSADD
ncbi:MAG: response regulator [Leptospiraceae bacterium]|nr:response regulator [Leptospiraceae bacterium]